MDNSNSSNTAIVAVVIVAIILVIGGFIWWGASQPAGSDVNNTVNVPADQQPAGQPDTVNVQGDQGDTVNNNSSTTIDTSTGTGTQL